MEDSWEEPRRMALTTRSLVLKISPSRRPYSCTFSGIGDITVPSEARVVCVLGPPCPPPGSALLHIHFPAVGIAGAELFDAGRDFVGVETYTVSGVPEPSTWAMLTTGFVGLWFAGYRGAKARSLSFAGA